MTIDARSLEEKIRTLYPEIGKHSLGVSVTKDAKTGDWLISIDNGEHSLSTHISEQDAADCIDGTKCVHLGVQIGTFVENYCLGGGACLT